MARYQVALPFPGVNVGDFLQLDESKRTFAMKGLVYEGWLFVLVAALIPAAITDGYIVEVQDVTPTGPDAGMLPRPKNKSNKEKPNGNQAQSSRGTNNPEADHKEVHQHQAEGNQTQSSAPARQVKTPSNDGTIDLTR